MCNAWSSGDALQFLRRGGCHGQVLIDSLAERLETLERENRLWRRGGGFALIAGLVVGIGGAQRANDPKVVEAEQLIVPDKDAAERVFRDSGRDVGRNSLEGRHRRDSNASWDQPEEAVLQIGRLSSGKSQIQVRRGRRSKLLQR
jgi:hypothetical protein